jgi:hypothetical protein
VSQQAPKAPDHEVNYWRTAALFMVMLGVGCWTFIPGGFWLMTVLVSIGGGCWALTRGRE